MASCYISVRTTVSYGSDLASSDVEDDNLNENLKEFENNFIITSSPVDAFIKSSINTYDIVFYDPPFELDKNIVENTEFVFIVLFNLHSPCLVRGVISISIFFARRFCSISSRFDISGGSQR